MLSPAFNVLDVLISFMMRCDLTQVMLLFASDYTMK